MTGRGRAKGRMEHGNGDTTCLHATQRKALPNRRRILEVRGGWGPNAKFSLGHRKTAEKNRAVISKPSVKLDDKRCPIHRRMSNKRRSQTRQA
jgi:hypothetical protein